MAKKIIFEDPEGREITAYRVLITNEEGEKFEEKRCAICAGDLKNGVMNFVYLSQEDLLEFINHLDSLYEKMEKE